MGGRFRRRAGLPTLGGPPNPRPYPGLAQVQEGCNHQCRYCIVPKVRGPRRSLEPAAVLAALQQLAAVGYREVVLTGVDLGQFGLDHAPPVSLAALVRRLAALAWPFRVRLSSLEPMMVTPELLDGLAAWGEFCPHFHLPLQSGAAPVLAAMGRPYGPEEFRDLVREISRRFPGAGLGLDVLVGFPGETAADFEATRSLVAELPVTYLHVFPYSPRPGTPAADLPPLPGKVVQARSRIMRELGQAKKTAFLAAQLGQVREVLVEGPGKPEGWLQGLSDHYLRVTFPGPLALHNRRVMVRFTRGPGAKCWSGRRWASPDTDCLRSPNSAVSLINTNILLIEAADRAYITEIDNLPLVRKAWPAKSTDWPPRMTFQVKINSL